MNIVDSIKQEITAELINTLATANNETVEKTSLTLDTSITSILLAFMKRASTETGLHLLYKMTKEDNFSLKKPLDQNLGIDRINKASDEGNALISKIIPDKKSPLITFVSSFSGVRNATANRTNGIAILLILNKLKEESISKSLEIGGLAELFADQKDHLLESAPKKLIERLSQHIGLGNLISLGSSIISTSTTLSIKNDRDQQKTLEENSKYTNQESPSPSSGDSKIKNWIIPAVFGLLVLAAAGYYYFTQVASQEETDESISAQDSIVNTTKALAIDSLKKINSDTTAKIAPTDTLVIEQEEYQLPDGQKILLEKGNIDTEVAKFLADTTKATRKSIVTSSATFTGAGTEIIPEKAEKFNNIGKIMKAYPSSGIKITVNTYNINDSTFSDKTGNKRAFALKKLIMNNGIQTLRIDALGKPHQSSNSDNLKAKEVELVIMKK
jgi:outer membrane protein OmpA-like peptidoglycan-associated protein